MTKNTQPIEFLWLGLYGFAGFSLEIVLNFLVNLLRFSPLSKGINSILTGILWFSFTILLVKYAKNKFGFDLLSSKPKLSKKSYLMASALVIIITLITFWGFNGFKPLMEFKNGSQGKILTYLFQIFYYLGESLLITLTIAFGQQFAEKQFSTSTNIPSGGLFLALTWGTMHFALQGISGGLFTILFSILAGFIYVICKKDFRWSYLFIAIAFIL